MTRSNMSMVMILPGLFFLVALAVNPLPAGAVSYSTIHTQDERIARRI